MTQLIGLDAGTSALKIAIAGLDGNPLIQPNEWGELSTPSVVYFDGDRVIIGTEARNAGLADSSRYVVNWKRHMGTGTVLFTADDGTEYLAKDILRLFVAEIARNYEAKTGEILTDIVISVPANYTDLQKQETIEAVEAVGLHALTLPHEPTAAAQGNRIDRRGSGLVLVPDLGGGTFDVSVLEVSGNNITVRTTNGIPDLGGEDFNGRLRDELLDRFEAEHGIRLTPDRHALAFQDLTQRIEQAKHTLSIRDQASVFLSCEGKVLNTTITRQEFEDLTSDLCERAMDCIALTIEEVGIKPASLREILLVGGGSQMPMFGDAIEKRFGRKPSSHAEPHFAAAMGNIIAGRQELERQGKTFSVNGRRIPPPGFHTRDVTAHPIGVSVLEGNQKLVNSVVLPKSAPMPSDQTVPFKLAEPGQTEALIEVLQGPDGIKREACHVLGYFELTGMTPVRDGDHRIEIRLHIDRNGMLDATAYDPLSGRKADLTIDTKKDRATVSS